MQDSERHKEAFISGLDRLMDDTTSASDERALIDARIRSNVLDILRKMYATYHDAAWHGRGPTKHLKLDQSLPRGEQVQSAFDHFASHLRESWSTKLEKDLLFGREEDARKGRLMLGTLDEALALLGSLQGEGS